jgi:hypothetical protein
MPRTVIKVTTYMCPDGIGDVNAECRFHRRYDNLPADNQCPNCNLTLVKATSDDDRQTLTVIGAEDIELEILDPKIIEERGLDNADAISSYRAARTLEMEAAIIAARVHEDLGPEERDREWLITFR